MNLTRALIGLQLVAAPHFAGSQTWVVSTTPCPTVDFADAQSAVDAAAEGDTILIRSTLADVGGFEVVGKSLTILGDRDLTYGWEAQVLDVTVRDLVPGQAVVLEGVAIREGLVLEDNAGSVWVEACTIELPVGATTPTEIVRVEDCLSVAFARCTWFQTDSTFGLGSIPHGGGQVGLDVVRSDVHLFDCQGNGARGVRGLLPSDPMSTTDGLDGGAALRLVESTAYVAGTTLEGGDGGPGAAAGGPFCGNGGDGAPAILIADALGAVRVLDSTLTPGVGGPKADATPPAMGSCTEGTAGAPVEGPGIGTLESLVGTARSVRFLENGLYREGDAATLELTGEPGDLVFWGVGVAQDHEYLADFLGTSVLTPLKVFKLGFVPIAGTKAIPLLIGDLTIPGEAITALTQGYFFDLSLIPFISSPAAVVIVDSTSDPVDGCSLVVHVDDDAPGDPGPGDPTVSDPLEDGSPARPYDSIQEAVDGVQLPGSTVLLADGTYVGAGNGEVDFPPDSHMVVASANGPANCFIYAGSSDFGFKFDNPTDLRADGLRGLRITGAQNRAVWMLQSSASIRDCVIEGNAGVNGAGIFVNQGEPLIEGCFIRSNVASVKGGGIYTVNSSPEIRNCQLTNNAALDTGGGISLGSSTGANIQGCTVANNVGGGIELRATLGTIDPLVVANCIVRDNTFGAQIEFTWATLEIEYGNVEGGLAGILSKFGEPIVSGPGLIDVDPLFVNPAGFDYHLSPGSPCEDAGDPLYLPLVGETDVDGDPRVIGAAIDLGSDEL